MPSRGSPNNSSPRDKWMATPSPVSLRSNEMMPFDRAQPEEGTQRPHARPLGAGKTFDIHRFPQEQVFHGSWS